MPSDLIRRNGGVLAYTAPNDIAEADVELGHRDEPDSRNGCDSGVVAVRAATIWSSAVPPTKTISAAERVRQNAPP